MIMNTKQVRIIYGGLFDNLMKKIIAQFNNKHGFEPPSKDICEAMAKAIIEKKLF